jgi:arginine N-succinyltransferase
MLEHEGFVFDRYVDIFDGGPTVTARTDDIRTVRESRQDKIAEIGEGGTQKVLAAAGRLKDFRACCASIKKVPRKGIMIDRQAAELLEVEVGDTVLTVAK